MSQSVCNGSCKSHAHSHGHSVKSISDDKCHAIDIDKNEALEKKVYYLKGSLCPNCANKIEDYLKSSEYVKKLNFDKHDKIIEITGISTYKLVKHAVDRFEPGLTISEKKTDDAIKFPITLGIALLLWIVSFLGDRYYPLSIMAVVIAGYSVVRDGFMTLFKGGGVDEKFLMSISAIGALLLNEAREGAAVMVLYRLGEYLTDRAVSRATKSLSNLMLNEKHFANVIMENGDTKSMDSIDIPVESKILVQKRDIIPLDSVVLDNDIEVDNSSFTGESEPCHVRVNEVVKAGAILLSENAKLKVIKDYEHSSIYRMQKLVQRAKNTKSNQERLLTKFARWYTPIVISLAGIMAITPIFGILSLKESIERALTFLVTACPCALILGVPLSYVVGIGAMSRKGILVKGSKFIDAMSKLDMVSFDKTGTLTENALVIDRVELNGIDEKKFYELMAIGGKFSYHPIARTFKKHGVMDPLNYREIPGEGIDFELRGEEFKYRIRKGEEKGSINLSRDGNVIATCHLSEKLKDDSKKTIDILKSRKIRTVIVSGDDCLKVKVVSDKLGIDEYHFDMTPTDKLNFIDVNKTANTLSFVGDGINDSAVLKGADVGISMGQMGSDIAIESSDVVIMDDDIRKVPLAIIWSKRCMNTTKSIVAIALIVKVGFLSLVSVGLLTMYLAVIGDVGLSLFCVLFALRNNKMPKLN